MSTMTFNELTRSLRRRREWTLNTYNSIRQKLLVENPQEFVSNMSSYTEEMLKVGHYLSILDMMVMLHEATCIEAEAEGWRHDGDEACDARFDALVDERFLKPLYAMCMGIIYEDGYYSTNPISMVSANEKRRVAKAILQEFVEGAKPYSKKIIAAVFDGSEE